MINTRNVGPTGLVLAAALLLASCGKASDEGQPVQDEAAARAAALASQNAPSYGDASAKVHIVEFLLHPMEPRTVRASITWNV